MTKVSPEDFVAIHQLVGEYQWRVDDGEDSWVEFWVEDGVFNGGATQTFTGHAELLQVPRWVKSSWNGAMRHLSGSFFVKYGDTTDVAIAKYYNFVSSWNEAEPKMFTLALSTMRLVRKGEDWKIQRLDAQQLMPPRDLGATS
jgi:hypothetical protein